MEDHAPTPRPGAEDPLLDAAVVERLVRHDELSSAERTALAESPRVAAVLERLEAADRWLELGAVQEAPAEMTLAGMPPAELLYDAAGGPGALDVDDEARAAVAAHLSTSPGERAWVEGLRRRPPSPLILDPLPEVNAGDSAGNESSSSETASEETPLLPFTPAAPTRSRAWLAWTPLAAAALLLAMALGGGVRPTVLDGGFPRSPLVRGDREPGPLFPRGRVVEGGAFAAAPFFEFVSPARATAARLELRLLTSDGADPFEEGQLLWSAAASQVEDAPSLAAGRYEWRLFATVDGLETEQGSETFRVVAGHVGLRSAASGTSAALPDVIELHAAGFLTDARHRARALPKSEERTRYLAGR